MAAGAMNEATVSRYRSRRPRRRLRSDTRGVSGMVTGIVLGATVDMTVRSTQPASWRTLLTCLSTSDSPAVRSGTLPDCHLSTNWPNVSWYAGPAADAGVVELFGKLKMSRNVLNSGSIWSCGEASASVVVGTFLMPLASLTRAPVSVVRYLISAQAASGFFEFFETPITLPVRYPAPYMLGSAVGTGAVPN